MTMWFNIFVFAVLYTDFGKVLSAILDSRCYLEGGGSAESFLATEDLTIGSIVGKLRINGDPRQDVGDINLSLREKDVPVEIAAGTKNIILTKALDKEGIEGSSSIYINVICIRRHSNDPSFVIPVNVRVTDVNDNSPEWIGAPYSVTLSEVTVPGTRILQGTRAVDKDQQGPFATVEYQVLPGTYSSFVQFLNPLEGTLVLKQALDFESRRNFTVKLRAQDQGTPPKYSDTSLKVIITDADDQNPTFLQESYHGLIMETGEIKIFPQKIKAVDKDVEICAPIEYSIVPSSESSFFKIDPVTGNISLESGSKLKDILKNVTLVIRATQTDNEDRYALTAITLSTPNNSDLKTSLRFVQENFSAKIPEDTKVGSRLLAVPTNMPEQNLKYYITDPLHQSYFSVGPLGEIILQKSLDYEKATEHYFEITATDGFNNATAKINIQVIDVNDWEPRFRKIQYDFSVSNRILQAMEEKEKTVAIGRIEAADGDRNDKLEFSLKGEYANSFEIDGIGNIWIKNVAITKQFSTFHLLVTATDTGVPSRSTSVPITITVESETNPLSSSNNNVLGILSCVIILFIIIIIVLPIYLVKSKSKQKTKPLNRVFSHANSNLSESHLVNHEKISSSCPPLGESAVSNPNITSLSKSIKKNPAPIPYLLTGMTRASRYENDMCSPEIQDTSEPSPLNRNQCCFRNIDDSIIVNVENPTKNFNWRNDKSNLISPGNEMGSTENNLTVYF